MVSLQQELAVSCAQVIKLEDCQGAFGLHNIVILITTIFTLKYTATLHLSLHS